MDEENPHCPRCLGLMLFTELRENCSVKVPAWECILCGSILDPVILANRLNRPSPYPSPRRSKDLKKYND